MLAGLAIRDRLVRETDGRRRPKGIREIPGKMKRTSDTEGDEQE
jgi:hypothetical protein